MDSTEGERIKCVVKYFGTQENFANAIGVSQPNVANWVRRGSLPSKAIRLIAERCPQVSVEYIKTGRGTPFVVPVGASVEVPVGASVEVPVAQKFVIVDGQVRMLNGKPQKRNIPGLRPSGVVKTKGKQDEQNLGKRKLNEKLYEASSKASSAILIKDGKISYDALEIAEATKIGVVPIRKEAEAYVVVKGFAMSPTIEEGDVIGVSTIDMFETYEKKNIYLLALKNGDILIRRISLQENEEVETLTLVSDNPKEKNKKIMKKDITDIKRIIYIGKQL